MIQIKILREFRNGIEDLRVLSIDEIFNIEWTSKSNSSNGVYCHKECYILYLPENIEKNRDYFEFMENELEDYFDDYELSEEQFEFLKIKLL